MRGKNFMTLLKNAKNGQNAHHSIESTLLSQSPTVKGTRSCFTFLETSNQYSWDPDTHGCSSTLKVCHAMMKNHILLNEFLYAK